MRILLVEDERSLSRALVKILEKNGYTVDPVYNGEEALEFLHLGNYDAMILDLMMPVLDGMSVLRSVRGEGNGIPILILTAKSDVDDKVAGLDSGANDYLTKPFEMKELLARLRVITRCRTAIDSTFAFGNVVLNRATYTLSTPTSKVRLANKEFQLLELLLANPGHIISPERILEKVWGYDSDTEVNVVWVYISYLRRKLLTINADIRIKASRNAGYTLELIDDRQA